MYRGAGFDYNFGVFVREDQRGAGDVDTHIGARIPPPARKPGEPADPLRVIQDGNIPKGGVPAGVESRLPGHNLTAKDGVWQIVSGTRSVFQIY